MHSHEQLPDVRRRNLATATCCLCKCLSSVDSWPCRYVQWCLWQPGQRGLLNDSVQLWQLQLVSRKRGSIKHSSLQKGWICVAGSEWIRIYVGRIEFAGSKSISVGSEAGAGRPAAAFPTSQTSQQSQPYVPTAPAIPINCPTASQQQPEPHSGTNRSSARK